VGEVTTTDSNGRGTGDTEQLITVRIGEQTFGFPILQVQGIIEPHNITPVPLAPPAVAGVMNVRGRIVTCIDLRVCLGFDARPRGQGSKGVTVEHRNFLYAILVDSIEDVQHFPRSQFENPPATLDEALRRFCSGIYRREADLIVVLDIFNDEALRESPGSR